MAAYAETPYAETPHDKFCLTKPLIETGLQYLGKYITRLEGHMYRPTYDECVVAMANNGWDHDSFVDLLDDLTNGKFRKSPDIFFDKIFDKTLAQTLLTAVLPIEAIGQDGRDVSFMWPIKVMRLRKEIEFDDAKRAEKIRQDLYPSGGPNTMKGALKFAFNLLSENGQDFFSSGKDGANPLMSFALGLHPKSPKLVETVIEEERKRDPSLANLQRTDDDKNTVLHYALRNIAIVSEPIAMRKAAIAKSLIVAGLDLFQENAFGQRPIDEVSARVATLTGLPKPGNPHGDAPTSEHGLR